MFNAEKKRNANGGSCDSEWTKRCHQSHSSFSDSYIGLVFQSPDGSVITRRYRIRKARPDKKAVTANRVVDRQWLETLF
jgi:hypothetical protein